MACFNDVYTTVNLSKDDRRSVAKTLFLTDFLFMAELKGFFIMLDSQF